MSARCWGEAGSRGLGDREDRAGAWLRPAAASTAPHTPNVGAGTPHGPHFRASASSCPQPPGVTARCKGTRTPRQQGKLGAGPGLPGEQPWAPPCQHREQQGRAGAGSRQEQALVPFLMRKQITLQHRGEVPASLAARKLGGSDQRGACRWLSSSTLPTTGTGTRRSSRAAPCCVCPKKTPHGSVSTFFYWQFC